MKKKKYGFTLTEFIAVIAILALIVLIAIPAYNSIRKRTLETQYKNVIKLIETAAEKYASKTGNSVALVQNLIDAGLIETDDGDNVLDPRYNSSLNCYPIEIEYKRGQYNAKFINKEVNSCQLDDAVSKYGDINIIRYYGNEANNIELSAWTGLNPNTLKIKFTDETLNNQEGLKYKWVTSSGQLGSEPTLTISTSNVYNGIANVQVTDKDNNMYFTSASIKIDIEKPIIEDVLVSCDGECKNGRKVTIKATDKNGSGIGGYYISSDDLNDDSVFADYTKNSISKFISSDKIKDAKTNPNDNNTPAKFYVYVKDKVGNISEKKEVKLNIKDTTPPECKWSGEAASDTDWAKSRTITLSCEDRESGCHADYDSYSRTFNVSNSVILTQQLSYTIKDNAGNETVCSKDANVFVDTIPPSKPVLDNKSGGNWTNSDIKVEATTLDEGSGVANWEWSSDAVHWYSANPNEVTDNNQKYTSTWVAEGNTIGYYRVYDNVGNYSEVASTYIKIDKTAPKKPNIVNNYYNKWSNSSITLQVSSSDSGSGIGKWYWGYSGDPWQEDTSAGNRPSYSSTYYLETNDITYIKVCDKAGNCSDSSSTTIMIDKTPPSIDTVYLEKVENDKEVTKIPDAYVRKLWVKISEYDNCHVGEPSWLNYDEARITSYQHSVQGSTGYADLETSWWKEYNAYWGFQNFRYSGSTDNVLTLTIQVQDNAGNTSFKTCNCYYSTNACTCS